MTEKQYENLMYALSTIIALGKYQNRPCPSPGISYSQVENIFNVQLEAGAEEVYKNLTGSPSNREVIYKNNTQEAVREVEESMKAELEKQAALEEEEKAKQAEQAEFEKIKNKELAKREANRVVSIDYLAKGKTHEQQSF
jgi:uncharacterized membrane protein YqiK